ncbi:hypothetical protein E2562_002534 [Oryza meyeriana var. granulata]|uniref:Uncharacterized protein n=1 Tax=Oryza meyeriana var. granulata TaxID=110450 RepID=A0A6G1F2W8_9ORYZ|nr:hypothetical protein E2562_002534 [Oryza meyeriana var. granulata]
MVHNVGDYKAAETKASKGARPTRVEAKGGTHAVAADPAHPERVAKGHIDKSYQARNPELARYLAAFRRAETHFRGVTVAGTLRANIADADALAKAAAANTPLPLHVMYEVLSTPAARPSDTLPSTMAIINTTPD